MAFACKRVKLRGVSDELIPGCRRMYVYFDHAWIGGHFEHSDSRVEGQRVSLQHHRYLEISGRLLDCSDEIQIISNIFHRRHEHVKLALAWLYAACPTRAPCRRSSFRAGLSSVRCRLRSVSHGRGGEKFRPARGSRRQHVALRERIRL